MSTLCALPEEIIIRILQVSEPSSIRRCSQVCRLLHDIIINSLHIQYLLELDICGYVEPAHIRTDLTYPEKIDLLRSHKTLWDYPNKVVPVEYELNSDEHGVTYEYAGGVYVRGVPLVESNRLTRRLYFYQLPSRNRGSEYRQWCIPDLGVDVRDFGICPEQDLLVLLELNIVKRSPPLEINYRIHLRTMSTNEAHPRTKPEKSIIKYHSPRVGPPPDRSFYFEISGNLLAILFRSRTRAVSSDVVIWDWTTGTELTCAPTIGGWNSSFTLLSKNIFVLPRFSQSYETGDRVPHDTFGSLNLYQFDLDASVCSEPRHIASFDLPPLPQKNGESSVQIRCSPNVVTPNSYSYSKFLPKVYDLRSEDRLLCVDIHRTPVQGIGFAEHAGTLFVSSEVLLRASPEYRRTPDQGDCLKIPWSAWAGKVSWADTRYLRTGNECYMYGQRSVAFQNSPISRSNSIIIFDFDSRRLRARNMLGADPQGVVCTPGDGSLDRIAEFVGKVAFCSEDAPASKKYVRMALSTELDQDVDFWDTVMVDDEHILIKRVRQEGRFSLLVYSF